VIGKPKSEFTRPLVNVLVSDLLWHFLALMVLFELYSVNIEFFAWFLHKRHWINSHNFFCELMCGSHFNTHIFYPSFSPVLTSFAFKFSLTLSTCWQNNSEVVTHPFTFSSTLSLRDLHFQITFCDSVFVFWIRFQLPGESVNSPAEWQF
jgi:hypothetical protein